MGLFRQEHWSELPFPPPGDLPHQGIEQASPVSPALAGKFFIIEPTGKPLLIIHATNQEIKLDASNHSFLYG